MSLRPLYKIFTLVLSQLRPPKRPAVPTIPKPTKASAAAYPTQTFILSFLLVAFRDTPISSLSFFGTHLAQPGASS